MRIIEAGAGARGGDGRFLRGQHQFVYGTLRPGEAAIGREGARDVAGVAVQLAAGIDQHQFACPQRCGIGTVMQHAGVGAGRHDAGIGRVLRAMPAEGVQQLGLQMVFTRIHATAQQAGAGLHGAHVGFGTDLCSAAHGVQLARVLDQAHLVEQGAGVELACGHQRTLAHAGAQAVQPAGHAALEAGMGGKGVGHAVGAIEQARQFRVDLRAAEGGFHTQRGRSRFRAQTVAVPDFAFQILGLAEQRGMRARLGIGAQHQRGARLGKAGQVEEVAVMPVRKIAVAVAGPLGGSGNHGHGIRPQQGSEACAALRVEGEVGHGVGIAEKITAQVARQAPLSPVPARSAAERVMRHESGQSSHFSPDFREGWYDGPTRSVAGRQLVPVFSLMTASGRLS